MFKFTPSRRLTGGMRLAAHKTASTERPVKRGFVPPRLVVSTRQQSGPAAAPVVSIGQTVLRGEIIARSESEFGADLHAPSSGKISAIEKHDVPLASEVTSEICIVIETDGHDREVAMAPVELAATQAERIAQIRTAGIVGLGGAIYPTAAKISLDADENCQLLIINGAECEPYISCDDMLMRESPTEIVQGAEILRQLVNAPKCLIAIERDKPQAIDAITAATEKLGFDGLGIAELPSIYPSGGERQLVEVLAGVEVPNDRYPNDDGFLCQNVGTAFAVHQYYSRGEPLTSRIVTVTGSAVAEPQNIEARIGTPIRDLIDACGGYRSKARRLIQGGTMMGFALSNDSLPITAATNCVIAAESFEVNTEQREWPCIRCGECSIVCPARLQPQELVLAAREANPTLLMELSLSECIECGCCDAVCPSHIPLTREFRAAKPLVQEFRSQQEFSEASDQRYRMHEQRQLDATSAAARRREQIKRALNQDEQRTEEIKAAVERARQRKLKTDGN